MFEGAPTDIPHLDHVSLAGERAAFEESGFRVTDTDGVSPHGRVFFDRTYLEVTPPAVGESGLRSRGWFLRPRDAAATARILRAAGLTVKGPEPYRAEDGNWLDVTISDPITTALPIFTRRIGAPECDWPPRLDEPHPNGAHRLAALHLRLRDPTPLVSLFEILGIPSAEPGAFSFPGAERIVIETSAGGPDGIVTVVVDRAEGGSLALGVEPADN
jgi:hypothetical protein